MHGVAPDNIDYIIILGKLLYKCHAFMATCAQNFHFFCKICSRSVSFLYFWLSCISPSSVRISFPLSMRDFMGAVFHHCFVLYEVEAFTFSKMQPADSLSWKLLCFSLCQDMVCLVVGFLLSQPLQQSRTQFSRLPPSSKQIERQQQKEYKTNEKKKMCSRNNRYVCKSTPTACWN